MSPDGSAARSRLVKVGDQLASINGNSSSKMKVDDICDAISKWSDQSRIELVFIRYIGPFRPVRKTVLPEKVYATTGHKDRATNTLGNKKANTMGDKKATKKKAGFRLFGKGKKKT